MKFAKIILAAAMAVAFGVPIDARGAAYEWYFSDDRNMHFAEATFGEPDTDARLIRFTCQSGVLRVQGPLPDRWMEQSEDFGARMRIGFSMPDGKRHVIDAEMADVGDGANYVGKIAPNHPLIAALMAGKPVRVQRVDFRGSIEVPAQGAAQPLRSLIAACGHGTTKTPPKPAQQ
jgi:hypothetical protein